MVKRLCRLIAISTLSLASACSKQPRIAVTTTARRAVVSVETLGEYGTTVRRAILKDLANGRVIWQIDVKSGVPQIHRLTFDVGSNSIELAKPQGGDYS